MKKIFILILAFFSIQVNAIQFNFIASIFGRGKYDIKNFGTYRSWGDGTIAKNCDEYKIPLSPYRFAGDNPNFGTYRIQPVGAVSPYDVDCNLVDGTTGTIDAVGGTVSYSGNYRIHTFLAGDNSAFSIIRGSGNIEYLIVAGGGAGGHSSGQGGGGAGGLKYNAAYPATKKTYSISVGTGGLGTTADLGNNGLDSSFDGIVSLGGGGGGRSGGSGGGSGSGAGASGQAGQGNNGGAGNVYGITYYRDGGGGGAGGVGGNAGTSSSPDSGGAGGAGFLSSISGTAKYYAGGGGGSGWGRYGTHPTGGLGGSGVGGNGGSNYGNGFDGIANTGSGGGGGATGGSGSTGIVIIKYQYKK